MKYRLIFILTTLTIAWALALGGAAVPANPVEASDVCPADVGVGDPHIADPWLLTNDRDRYPIAAADVNADGFACVFDPFLVTTTSVLIDDNPRLQVPPEPDFQLLSLEDIREIGNPHIFEEALANDRNENGFVLLKFVPGADNMPIIVVDNMVGNPHI